MQKATLDRHAHLLIAKPGETADELWQRAATFTARCCYDERDQYSLIEKQGGRRCDVGVAVTVDCDKVVDRVDGKIYDLVESGGSTAAKAGFGFTGHFLEPGMKLVTPPKYDGSDSPIPQPKPPAPAMKSRDQFGAEFSRINSFYGSRDGLQRVGGMVGNVDASVFKVLREIAAGTVTDLLTIQNAAQQVLGVQCDVDAMKAWGYDLMAGATPEAIEKQIRQSGEWRAKHPGENP